MEDVDCIAPFHQIDNPVRILGISDLNFLDTSANGGHWAPVDGVVAVLHSHEFMTHPFFGPVRESAEYLPRVAHPFDGFQCPFHEAQYT